MHFIIGGAYQGKLTFAKEKYGFSEEQIFDCARENLEFSRPCITHLEEFTYGCAQRGKDPVAYFKEHRDEWKDSVLICRDISGGVIPMELADRLWREATGHLCQYLSKQADHVSRIFCGLEQRLK